VEMIYIGIGRYNLSLAHNSAAKIRSYLSIEGTTNNGIKLFTQFRCDNFHLQKQSIIYELCSSSSSLSMDPFTG
jgi:hypothetical protein